MIPPLMNLSDIRKFFKGGFDYRGARLEHFAVVGVMRHFTEIVGF